MPIKSLALGIWSGPWGDGARGSGGNRHPLGQLVARSWLSGKKKTTKNLCKNNCKSTEITETLPPVVLTTSVVYVHLQKTPAAAPQCPVHVSRPARPDDQRCGTKWQEGSQHPRNTIPCPNSMKKLHLQGQAANGTAKSHGSRSHRNRSAYLGPARCASRGQRRSRTWQSHRAAPQASPLVYTSQEGPTPRAQVSLS